MPDDLAGQFPLLADRAETPKDWLVGQLLAALRPRYPWLTSSLLHVMAFRPDVFQRDHSAPGFGPLYRPVRVPKGGGRFRLIHIPNRPLQAVQRWLLRTVLGPAQDRLSAAVTGCRPGGSPFANAAAHAGQRFVVTADLADFFPSVETGLIVPALLALGRLRAAAPRSPRDREPRSAADRTAEGPGWDQPTAVLVARLVTRRGRLPQGAPTSPAVANLSFARLDERIARQLGPAVVYTRYVDDLTFSVSVPAARALRVTSPASLRDYVLAALDRAFRFTPFRLNPRKTRCGRVDDGFEVTGLRIRRGTAAGRPAGPVVDLSRADRRYVRCLVHQLRGPEQGGPSFAEVARRRVGGEVFAQAAARPGEPAAGDLRRHRGRRRTTPERLARVVARHLFPRLTAEVPGADRWEEVPTDERWRVVERVIGYLWAGRVTAHAGADAARVTVRSGRGEEICRLTDPDGRSLAFFRMGRRDGGACVELWHHIQGLLGWLNVCDGSACFDPIRAHHARLREAAARILPPGPEDVTPPVSPPDLPGSPDEGLTVTLEPEVRNVAASVRNRIEEFLQATGDAAREPPDGTFDAFLTPPTSTSALARWADAARALTTGRLPHVPVPDGRGPRHDALLTVRVVADRLNRRRGHRYIAEAVVLRREADRMGRRECLEAARFMLGHLDEVFVRSLRECGTQGPERWTRHGLAENPYCRPQGERLAAAGGRFTAAHRRLVARDGSPVRVFTPETANRLARIGRELADPVVGESSGEVWQRLFEWALLIVGVTWDHLDPALAAGTRAGGEAPDEREESKDLNRTFARGLRPHHLTAETIKLLRNRVGHQITPKRYDDWLTVQERVAGRLGREFTRYPVPADLGLYPSGHLHLTPFEGVEVQIDLLDDFAAGLEQYSSSTPPASPRA